MSLEHTTAMAKYTRILVILNPSAGQQSADETRQIIETRMAAEQVAYELRTTEGAGDALHWAEAAPGEGFDLVVAAGGDGTIMEAMSGLIRSKSEVPLAQLPAGTANLLARAVTIPTDLEEALDVVFTGYVAPFDVGYLPEQERYFALVAGCGYDAKLIAGATRPLKNALGFAAYVVSGLKNLFTLRKAWIELIVDDERRVFRANTVMIANVGQFGEKTPKLGDNIHPHDGKLDVIIAKASSVRGALNIMLRILTGRFTGHSDLEYLSASRISIVTKPTMPTEIDGEVLGTTPLRIEAVPNGARLVVPQSYRPPEE